MTIVHRAPAGSTRPSCPNGPAWTGRSPSTHSRKAPPDASPRCTCPPETQPYTHTHDIVRTKTILYHNLNGEVDTDKRVNTAVISPLTELDVELIESIRGILNLDMIATFSIIGEAQVATCNWAVVFHYDTVL